MRFLALDTSKSQTAWARWATGEPVPSFNSFQCGSEYTDDGQAMEKLWIELDQAAAFGLPDVVAVESPADASNWAGGRKFQHTKSLVRLSGVVMFWARNKGIGRRTEIDKAHWFPAFIGPGQRAPKGESKSYCIARCRTLGLRPRNDDEADAIGILDYMIGLEGIVPPWRAENVLVRQLGGSRR
jgi:hypothetical protein